jgi:hypothetical protein
VHDVLQVFLGAFVERGVDGLEWLIAEGVRDLQAEGLASLDEALQVEVPLGKGYIREIVSLQGHEIAGGDVALDREDLAIEGLVLHNLDQAGLLDLLELEDLEELEVVEEGVARSALHGYYIFKFKILLRKHRGRDGLIQMRGMNESRLYC